MKIRISEKDVRLGQPLLWNLYNASGRVIFRQGFVFHTETAYKKFKALELFRDSEEKSVGAVVDAVATGSPSVITNTQGPLPVSQPATATVTTLEEQDIFQPRLLADPADDAFEDIKNYAVFLKTFYESVISNDATYLNDFYVLAERIRKLLRARTDECLAAIHLYAMLPQSLLQPIYAAMVSHILAGLAYVEPENYDSLVYASLTANLGMYTYYDELVNQAGKLTDQQRLLLHSHPGKSAMLLKNFGVKDVLWLDIVEHHHERGDGSGYPKGLQRDDIRVEASIYSVADTYLGLIMPKAFRPRQEPMVAIQKMHQMSVTDDIEILEMFVRFSGMFPPGSVVELANREIALVISRNPDDAMHPKIVSFGSSNGEVRNELRARDTHQKLYKIIGTYLGTLPRTVNLLKIYSIGRKLVSI